MTEKNKERQRQLPLPLSKGMMVYREFYKPDDRPGKSGKKIHLGSELYCVIGVDRDSNTAELGRIYTVISEYDYNAKPDFRNTVFTVPLEGGETTFNDKSCLVTGPIFVDDDSMGQIAERLYDDQARRVGDMAGKNLLELFSKLKDEGKISDEALLSFLNTLSRVRASGFKTLIDELREMQNGPSGRIQPGEKRKGLK